MTAQVQPRRIMSNQFWRALVDAGVLQEDDNVTRIVIDAQAGSVVVLYVERWADERLLQVAPTLDGIEIHGVPKESTVV